MDSDDILFWEYDMHRVIDSQRSVLVERIGQLDKSQLSGSKRAAVTQKMKDDFTLDVPVLDRSKIRYESAKTKIDVSRDPMRLVMDPRNAFVDGTEITFHVPFKGDPDLFKCKGSTYTFNPPRGRVSGSELLLTFRGEKLEADELKQQLEASLHQIDQYLSWLRIDATSFNDGLASLIDENLNARLSRFQAEDDLLKGLGFEPIVAPQNETKDTTTRARKTKTESVKSRSYDVFICHASEDKDEVARPLYELLKNHGVGVWFDEAELKIGDSLRQKIDEGLSKTKYGVVILSPTFLGKNWPKHELDGLVTKQTSEGRKVILPIWHKLSRTEVEGYSPILAGLMAANTTEGMELIAKQIMDELSA